MPRQTDPTLKPKLMERILDHLLEHPLATVSLRSLASALGVSTYSIVYHFGSREELVQQIVLAIERRQAELIAPAGESTDLDGWVARITASWEMTLEPRNRQLQRLEFEAAMLEALEPGRPRAVRAAMDAWREIAGRALADLGVAPEVAAIETRVMIDLVYGLQFDLLVTGEVEKVDAAFRASMAEFRRRILATQAARLTPRPGAPGTR